MRWKVLPACGKTRTTCLPPAAWPPRPILLHHHMQRAGPWRGRMLHNLFSLQLLELRVGCLKLFSVQLPKFSCYWWPLHGDEMPTPMWRGRQHLGRVGDLQELVQDGAAQGSRRQGDKPGMPRGLVSGNRGHSPVGLAALATTKLRDRGRPLNVHLCLGGTPGRCGSSHRRGVRWFGLAAHAGYCRQ